MLLDVLARSPRCRVFYEPDSTAYDDYRLRSEEVVRRLIAESLEDVVVFKPLNDTQRADRLLHTYPDAKVIWIYRCYRDVVNSAVRAWQGAQRAIILGIGLGEWRHPGQAPVTDRWITAVHPGCIILLHDNLYHTFEERYVDRAPMIDAVDMFIDRLGRAFTFVTVPELLREGRPHRKQGYMRANVRTLNALHPSVGEPRRYAQGNSRGVR